LYSQRVCEPCRRSCLLLLPSRLSVLTHPHTYSLTLTRLAGEATPSLRSQSEPEGRDASDGDVRVLVGSTYEQTVLRAARTHHTVVMLYVPWCSRSKRLAPEWLALAQRYKRDGGLLVAKLDARRRVQ